MKNILSRLLIVSFICVAHCTYLSAQNTITIVNEKVGKLQKTVEKQWKKDKSAPAYSDIKQLNLEGNYNTYDLNYVIATFPNVKLLNLSQVVISSSLDIVSFSKLQELQELYLPKTCSSFLPEQKINSLKRLVVFDNAYVSNLLRSTVVFVKCSDQDNEVDFNIPFVDNSSIFIEKSEKNNDNVSCRLKVYPSRSEKTRSERYARTKSSSENCDVIYFSDTKEAVLYHWRDHYAQDVLDVITEFAPNSMNLLSKMKLSKVIIKDGTKSIPHHCFSENKYIETIYLPKTLNKIDASAFSGSNIRSVCLSESLVEIGQSAFYYSQIDSIYIPSKVKTIPNHCFSNCKKLSYVKLNEGLEEVGDQAFYKTAITELNIPSTVTKIGKSAFENSELKRVILPAGLKSIYANTFNFGAYGRDTNMEYVELHSTTPCEVLTTSSSDMENFSKALSNAVISIPEGSFEEYSKSPSWRNLNLVERGKKISYNLTVKTPGSFLNQITIADLHKIDSLTVKGFLYDTDLKILKKCNSLRYVDISQAYIIESPETAKYKADKNDELNAIFGLIGIIADAKYSSGEMSSADYMYTTMYAEASNTLTKMNQSNSKCYIPSSAFKGLTSLEYIKLPYTAMSIGYNAFRDCVNLKNIELPLYLEEIKEGAFRNCTLLEEMTFPPTIKKIERDAFYGCSSMDKLDLSASSFSDNMYMNAFCKYSGEKFLPKGVTQISWQSLSGSEDITGAIHFPKSIETIYVALRDMILYFSGTTPPSNRKAITGCKIYVPKGYTTTYYNAFGSSNEYIEQ